MIALLIAVALPLAIWAISILQMPPHAVYEMDWGHHERGGSFFSIYVLYRSIARLIYWTSLVLSILVAVIARQEPAGVLMLAAVYAFLFDVWIVKCYESYSHTRYPKNHIISVPSNYTRNRYAITMALGYSAVILFVIGLLAAVIVTLER